MDAERRSRVKELFLAARGRRPEERAGYLDEACGADVELRRELESLLIEHDRMGADGKLAAAQAAPRGPDEAAAEPTKAAEDDPRVGASLGRYRILGMVGKGGMGTVYEAEDPELQRKVALKVLPPAVARDPKRLERFKREARSAAALSHPNVVTVHSVEEEGDTHFLTMELVEGEPLDKLIPKHGLDLGEILDRAAQLAEGLRAAHEQGILHRDLKPANLIVDTEGRLRILDFGLAKAQPARPEASQAETSLALTVQGTVLGTAPYMSPEQVEGKLLDARSDVFSFGSILYEMATGRWPFPGDTIGQVMGAVLHQEPVPLTQLRADLPQGLERIVDRCLEKEPAQRYQSARELRDALQDLKRAPVTTRRLAAGSRGRMWMGLSAAALAVVVLAALWLGRVADSPDGPPPLAARSVQKITNSGRVINAAISPDGKYVAYVESYQGQQSLHLRQPGGAQSLELSPPAPVKFWGLTFTPDGSALVFARKDEVHHRGALFRIATLGGPQKELVEDVESRVSFSPDGSRFTWLRVDPASGASSLMIADAEGSGERVLVTRMPPEVLAPRFFTAPSWSPDGRMIAASVMSDETERGRILGFDVETGAVAWISERSWNWISQVEWLPDGDALLAIAWPDQRFGGQIWYVPYPRGTAYQITDDPHFYRLVGTTADAGSLLTVPSGNTEAVLWKQRRDGTGPPTRISTTRGDGRFGFDLTADGRIVFTFLGAGRFELAVMNLDGSGRQVLTDNNQGETYPSVTAEGKVLFSRGMAAGGELRSMESDGGDSQLLSDLQGRYLAAALSPDGSWAVVPKRSGLWRLPLDGGEPTRLTDMQGYLPAISPRGTRLAFYFDDGEQERIGIMPSEGGALELTLEAPARTSSDSSLLRWAEDGEAPILNTMPGDRANLWRVPLDGSEPLRLTDFADDRLFWFEYTPDGETLVVSRGQFVRDAMLIRGFR